MLLLSMGVIFLVGGLGHEAWAQSAEEPTLEEETGPETLFNHGFRLGYLHLMNSGCTRNPNADDTCVNAERVHDIQAPHFFLIGYELTQRLKGNDWLNVLFVENITVGGLEQSLFIPSFNFMIGFEFANQLQIGTGLHLLPTEHKPLHMIIAVGYTPRIGSINVPVHLLFIPDVDEQHRIATTVGVNW